MKSQDCTINEIFKELGYIFKTPNYQRYYVWESEEIGAYLKDIDYCYEINNNAPAQKYDHFFGQIILRLCEEDRSARQPFEIVDGQQRLTTFTLTVAACYRLIMKNIEQIPENEKSQALNCLKEIKKDFLLSEPSSGSVYRRLLLSEHDNPSLYAIVNFEGGTAESFPEAQYESQKRIYNAYAQIYAHIENKFALIESSEYATTLKNYIDVFSSSLSVVVIKSTSLGYSYALYQIVNDRGVLLTPAELLKARTLELLAPTPSLFGECEKIWNDILSDEGSKTKNYLSWHYASLLYKNPTKDKLHEQYEKDILRCYGKRTITIEDQQNLANKIKELHQSILWSRSLSNGELPIEDIHSQIRDMYYALVIGLKNEYAIPLFINVLKIQNAELKINVINYMVLLLSKFFFVSKTIGSMHAGSVSSVYFDISRIIVTNPANYRESTNICQRKIIQKGIFDIFKTKISQEVYSKQSTTISKYLLYYLELFYLVQQYSCNEILQRDRSMPIKFSAISTEHIAARKSFDTDGIAIDANERNRIGNLTLIGTELNNSLDDQPYNNKRNIYAVSPYITTRSVASLAAWNRSEYETRQARLEDKIANIFTL